MNMTSNEGTLLYLYQRSNGSDSFGSTRRMHHTAMYRQCYLLQTQWECVQGRSGVGRNDTSGGKIVKTSGWDTVSVRCEECYEVIRNGRRCKQRLGRWGVRQRANRALLGQEKRKRSTIMYRPFTWRWITCLSHYVGTMSRAWCVPARIL